jgi:hypothetical protein
LNITGVFSCGKHKPFSCRMVESGRLHKSAENIFPFRQPRTILFK